MNNQEILDNAPKGATHVDTEGRWHKLTFSHKGFMLLNNDGDWDYCNPCTDLRSLADIKRIAELEKELKTPSKQGLLEVLELNDRHLGRIAELGKERNELKCKLSHSETMGGLEQAKRDLEQQAKGVNDFGKWVLDTDKNASGLDVRDIALIEFYVEPLISQAKALKEQVK